MKPWNLAELNYGQLRELPPFEVAVLPLGATEPHNLHLPYGTDTMQVETISEQACERATERGARVLLLPAMPFGTETNQMKFPMAMNVNPSTLARVIQDLVESLEQHGIRKMLLVNGHGGNDLKWLLRELYGKTSVHLFLCNWWKVGTDRYSEIFPEVGPGDHAGDLETSLIMHLRPELVDLSTADAGTMAETRLEAVNRGWIEITRPWHLLTTNSGAGDPRPATPAKGKAVLDMVVDRLAGFLHDLSNSPMNDRFPY